MRLLLIALLLLFPAALSADEVLFEMAFDSATVTRPIELPKGWELQYEVTFHDDLSAFRMSMREVGGVSVLHSGGLIDKPVGHTHKGSMYHHQPGSYTVNVAIADMVSGTIRIVKVE